MISFLYLYSLIIVIDKYVLRININLKIKKYNIIIMASSAKMALDSLIDLLEEKDFKKMLISELNEDVDIPMIGEKTEKKVFEAIYKIIVKNIKKIAES